MFRLQSTRWTRRQGDQETVTSRLLILLLGDGLHAGFEAVPLLLAGPQPTRPLAWAEFCTHAADALKTAPTASSRKLYTMCV